MNTVLLTYHDGSLYKVTVPSEVRARLKTTCFPKNIRRCAGEIEIEKGTIALLRRREIGNRFLSAVARKFYAYPERKNIRVTVDAGYDVGWESTDKMTRYHADMLELHAPGPKATCLRVKPECKDIAAPRTQLITFGLSIAEKLPGFRAHSIDIATVYPGVDVGRLSGDMTAKTGRVWFDWSHPGE